MSPFNRLFNVMSKPTAIISVAVVLVLCYFYVDRPLAQYLASLNLRVNIASLNWFTKLGVGLAYLVFFSFMAVFFRYVRPNRLWQDRFWFLLSCLLIANVICGVLKVMLGRARPSMWFENHLYGFYGFETKAPFWSFPSGHSTTIMAVVFSLSVIFPRYCYAFIAAGLSVAISRVLLTHHYLSDILSATYLTLLEVGFFLWYLQKRNLLQGAWKLNGNSLVSHPERSAVF